VQEHPDYFYGKVNLVNEYFYRKELDHIPEVLGKEMKIECLYIDRNTFHIDEVTGFFALVIRYYAETAEFELAEEQLKQLEKIAPLAPATLQASSLLMAERMLHGKSVWQERTKGDIKVIVAEQLSTDSTTDAPVFTHKEIQQLYQIDLTMDKEVLEKILSLPRTSLIKDLKRVLQDSIDRYRFYTETDDWNETAFPTHAFYLLGELKATESLEAMLNVLAQSEEYLEFYFGDFLTESLWEPLYKVASDNLPALEKFVCRPGIYCFARTVASDMLVQMVLHDPSRKEEVVAWFRSVFNVYIEAKVDDNIIDSDTIGSMVCSCLDMEAVELLPTIKKLYDLKYASEMHAGTYEDVVKEFRTPSTYSKKQEIMNIADRYTDIATTWDGYNQEDESDIYEDDDNWEKPTDIETPETSRFLGPTELSEPVVRSGAKIGRNDSCPCGSGKKYKKCCL